MPDLKTILENARTIAVVGCSSDPSRTSYAIARYLSEIGYRVIPVNPNCDEVLGETCYPKLQRIPADTQIDIVNIFRRSDHTAHMVADAVERAESTGTKPVIWTQLGVSSQDAQRLADEADLPYVRNRCIMVEHARLVGR